MKKEKPEHQSGSAQERFLPEPHPLHHYGLLFLGFLIVLTLLDMRIEDQTDYGLERLEHRTSNWFQRLRDDSIRYEPAVIAVELDVDIEDVLAGQYFLEAYLNHLDERERAAALPLSVTLGDLQFRTGPNWFFNVVLAFLGAAALRLRDRLRYRSALLEDRDSRLYLTEWRYDKHRRETRQMVEQFEHLRHRLVETEKLASLGRLSATLAHEIRNPLSIIKSSTEIALDDVKPDSSSAGAIALIREEISRLDRIIGELLKFARPREPRIECHGLRDLVRHWLPPIVEELEKDGIQLVPEVGEQPAEVFVDPDHLYQALLNVVWNARDAVKGSPPGRIFVRIRPEETVYTALEIEDTGSGMLPETLETIREPFFTTKTQGTGLGIPVSVQLLELMGGKMEIESEVEMGTTVRMLLRRGTPGAGEPAREEEQDKDADPLAASPSSH